MAFFSKSPLDRGLRKILGADALLTKEADVICYGFDSSGYEAHPSFVVLPENMEQVGKVVSLCNSIGVPVTPRGAGSATTGAAVPEDGGVVICFSRMNRIIDIDPVELTATVQPGVVTGDLQKEVEKQGLFYPPDPASLAFCTIGGNIATGAGGPRAVKYGVTRDYVRSLKVILYDGSLIETGARAAKGVVGYDITRLFVGSEGTLGIVVEAVLRLIPRPKAVGTLAGLFPSVESCVEAISLLFSSGHLPRCAEFLDEKCLKVVSSVLPMEIPPESRAFVIVEVDGDSPSVQQQIKEAKGCLQDAGALSIFEPKDQEQRQQLWNVRRGLSPALKGLGFDSKVSEDICMPRRAIREMLEYLYSLESDWPVRIFCFGHIGDGNIHVNLLFNHIELKRDALKGLITSIMNKTVKLGGTISGEHGVGLTKKDFVELELSERVLALEQGIKRVFDPNGIFNPGKVFKD